MTEKEVVDFLTDIELKLTESDTTSVHSLIALNQLLRADNAADIFQGEVKDRAKDVWMKIKSRGLDLVDPPLLFGIGTTDGAASA